MSKFDCAAYKLRAGHLSRCVPADPSSGAKWNYKYGRISVPLRVVWLQGTLAAVDTDGDTVRVADDDVTVCVTGCFKIPGGTSWLQKGVYCMVVGEVMSTSPAEVRVIKMSPLDHHHEELWPVEVEHVWQLISKEYTIS